MFNIYYKIVIKLCKPLFLNIFLFESRLRSLRKNCDLIEAKNLTAEAGFHFHFLVCPWEGTRVPWYQLYLASLISKNGCRVSFIIESFSYVYYPIHLVFVFIFRQRIIDEKSRNSQTINQLTFAERRACYENIKANITWYTKSELVWRSCHSIFKNFYYRRQCLHYVKVKLKISQLGCDDVIVIPGGVLSPSFSYVLACNNCKIKYYTYDSGSNGQVIFAREGVAAHLGEVESFDFSSMSSSHSHIIQKSADKLISDRMGSRDIFKYQKVKRGSNDLSNYLDPSKLNILVPLSCPWDAASLMRRDVYGTEFSFVKKILQTYKNENIIIRVHPIERLRSNSRYDDIFKLYKIHSNVKIISADTAVNTYDLVEAVDMVISRNTSLGAESFILGKTSVSSTISYWNDTVGLYPTSLDPDLVKMRYAIAQHYNWNFPSVNLTNVSFDEIDANSFDVFTDMALHYKRHIDVKLDRIIEK
ncbi:hypothetical protein [Roseobacter sp. HKCCD5988]|uniref:hypothetical protein n=1 Tax=Roseobacter sp. HKCCD5988 TaxID=3120338 RepID=UPI0030EB51DC